MGGVERKSKTSRAKGLVASSEDASRAARPEQPPSTMEEAYEIQSRYAAWALLRLRKAQFAADDYLIGWIELFATGKRDRLLQEADNVAEACWIAGYSDISRSVRRVAAEIADNNKDAARNAFANLTRFFGLRLEWSKQHQCTDPKALARIDQTLEGINKLVTLASTLKDFTGETEPRYTSGSPSSETAEPSAASGMRDDDLNIAIKQARTEVLARLVDLDNPVLSAKERLTRARRVVRSFERRHAEDPDFPASPEVRKAISIVNRDNYQKAKARKAKAEPALRRPSAMG